MAKNELHIFKYFLLASFWQKMKLKISQCIWPMGVSATPNHRPIKLKDELELAPHSWSMFRLSRCFRFDFWFGITCVIISFAVAIGTTISCSLGRLYGPVFSLSYLDGADVRISESCEIATLQCFISDLERGRNLRQYFIRHKMFYSIL